MTGHERRPDMHLTVLGAGTAVPSPRRSPAGYLLQVAGEPLLFDAGPGTLARLAVAGVSHQELRRVFISHLHSDHVLDLVTLLQASNATPGWTRAEPLELLGCRGLAELVRQVTAAFDGTVPEGFPLQITELGEERREFAGGGGWMVETALTGHTPGSLAFRVEAAGRTMVYSGDAVESEGLARLARGADTFVCECSFPRGWRTADHVTADGAGRMAQAAGARRLILSHLYPPAQEADVAGQARAEYEGEVVVAVDGTTVAV
jgi:ribonuclease BN (tRNA processing enzyme)